jgi:3-dehydroquinate synthase
MKSTLWIKLKKYEDRSYPIVIGTGLFPVMVEELKKKFQFHNYALVSDSNVMRIYGKKLESMMRDRGFQVNAISFPAGERSTTRRGKARIEDRMLKLGFGRDSCIIALGGGVTGDLAGFVAATYLRGISFIQVPTTLLAMVDAGVGGKTGIDLPAGKNLVGAFYQPIAVYASLDTLDTLPEDQYISGLAEAVKNAIICDRDYFAYLEKNFSRVLDRDVDVLARVVEKSCAIKASVVESDERESDLRRILNYGHTIGHAIEAASSYTMLHGYAVSIGMSLEGRLAYELGYFPRNELQRQNRILKKLGLPVSLKSVPLKKKSPESLLGLMRADKKVRAGRIEFVLPVRIGRMKRMKGQVGIPVQENILYNMLSSEIV